MNFSFWPFLWFGLPGRLLKLRQKCVKNARSTFVGEHLLDDTEVSIPHHGTWFAGPTPEFCPSQDQWRNPDPDQAWRGLPERQAQGVWTFGGHELT